MTTERTATTEQLADVLLSPSAPVAGPQAPDPVGPRLAAELAADPHRYLDRLAEILDLVDDARPVLRGLLVRPLIDLDPVLLPVRQGRAVVAAVADFCSRQVAAEADLGRDAELVLSTARGASPEELSDVIRRLGRVQAATCLTELRAVGRSVLAVGFTAQLIESGSPPEPVLPAGAERLADLRVELVLRHRASQQEWVLEASAGDDHRHRAMIDIRSVGGGRRLTKGIWDLVVRVGQSGLLREVRLGADRLETIRAAPILVHKDGRIDQVYFTADAQLSLSVGAKPRLLAEAMTSGRLRRTDRGVAYDTAVHWAESPQGVWLTLLDGSGNRVARWSARPDPTGACWIARDHRNWLLRTGAYRLRLSQAGSVQRWPQLADEIDLGATLLIDKTTRRRWLAGAARRLRRRLTRSGPRRLARIARQLPRVGAPWTKTARRR